jgi:hypothetical protein
MSTVYHATRRLTEELLSPKEIQLHFKKRGDAKARSPAMPKSSPVPPEMTAQPPEIAPALATRAPLTLPFSPSNCVFLALRCFTKQITKTRRVIHAAGFCDLFCITHQRQIPIRF